MLLHITQDGFQKQHVQLKKEDKIEIIVDERVNASVLFTYGGVESQLDSQITLLSNSSLTIMLRNEMQKDVHIKQHIYVHRDATLDIAYYDMENGSSHITCDVALMESGATANIQSAYIASTQKHMNIQVHHHVPYTVSDMKHYAIVHEHGDYQMEACGKIYKGAKESSSHQTTRVLTMSEHQKASVVPLLYIDEDDVKASHATTLGQPDEHQLYYLQTRGLSRNMALGLLTVGYLMPITALFSQDDIQQQLKNEIEMKVGLHA